MKLGARRSRVLGIIWILAGLALLGGAVVLWLDRRTLSVWEVPLALVAFVIGIHLWSQRVMVDRHGITLSSMLGSQRILWAGIAAVDMQATWWRPSMTIHRKGDGQTTPIRTTSGLTTRQRDVLYDLLIELSREHGFLLRRPGMPEVGTSPSRAVPTSAGRPARDHAGPAVDDAVLRADDVEGVDDEDAAGVVEIDDTPSSEMRATGDDTITEGDHGQDEAGAVELDDGPADDAPAPGSDPDATVAMEPITVIVSPDDDVTDEVAVVEGTATHGDAADDVPSVARPVPAPLDAERRDEPNG